MDNPGSFSLGDFGIAQAGSQTNPAGPVVDLAGMVSLGLFARFAYGGSVPLSQGQPGTPQPSPLVEAYVQTSFDQGQTWCDIACFAFTTSGGVLVANIVAGTPVGPPVPATNATLADNSVNQGLLGDQVQVVVNTTGTYTNSSLLSLWGVAR